ncbi:MAG: FAD:protein FMN transferase [Chitinophagales bacterium]
MRKVLFFIAIIALFSCDTVPVKHEVHLDLETMGTWGSVKIVSDSLYDEASLQHDIDSILWDVNMEFSTYIDSSTISRLNSLNIPNGRLSLPSEETFQFVYENAHQVMLKTNGAFDFKIKPLVDYYKTIDFDINSIDSVWIDSLITSNSMKGDLLFGKLCVNGYAECRLIDSVNVAYIGRNGAFQLDFSAIAKGYGVDVIAYYLEDIGVENYMVEIGGEVHVKGKNAKDEYWRLGIEEPNEEERSIYAIVSLQDKSMATSGNYRNFKILENGQKIVHIINPRTGYPEISNLLSATILADDCMSADAYATACMVMGLEDCYAFVDSMPDLDAYLIYSDENGDLQETHTAAFDSILVH